MHDCNDGVSHLIVVFPGTKKLAGLINFVTTQQDKSYTTSFANIEGYTELKPGKWSLRIKVASSQLLLVTIFPIYGTLF